jgi:hypothetical protein
MSESVETLMEIERAFEGVEDRVSGASGKPSPCGCNVSAGIVCPACSVMAEKNVEELSQYVNEFIHKRFPSGLEGDIRRIIVECVLDAFHDGARWAESQPPGEPDLIITDLNSPSKLIIT